MTRDFSDALTTSRVSAGKAFGGKTWYVKSEMQRDRSLAPPLVKKKGIESDVGARGRLILSRPSSQRVQCSSALASNDCQNKNTSFVIQDMSQTWSCRILGECPNMKSITLNVQGQSRSTCTVKPMRDGSHGGCFLEPR